MLLKMAAAQFFPSCLPAVFFQRCFQIVVKLGHSGGTFQVSNIVLTLNNVDTVYKANVLHCVGSRKCILKMHPSISSFALRSQHNIIVTR